jgi:hypothetical protein
MDWSDWIGKRIFVILNSGLKYSGLVLDADSDFIKIRDKFNAIVTFRVTEIGTIQEKAEGGYG